MKLLLSFVFVVSSFLTYAQEGKTTGTVSSSDCTCLEGFTVCKASSLFVNCCICCQPGSSCGAWSSFGILASCKCESTGTSKAKSDVRFFADRYEEFMNYLGANGINPTQLRNYASAAKSGKSVNAGKGSEPSYVALTGPELDILAEAYLADIKELAKDPKKAALINGYLNSKK